MRVIMRLDQGEGYPLPCAFPQVGPVLHFGVCDSSENRLRYTSPKPLLILKDCTHRAILHSVRKISHTLQFCTQCKITSE